MTSRPVDTHRRPLRNLRISVTDRCNLRCAYCMPEIDYVWLPRDHLLTFEELARVVRAAGALEVDKVRLTGGEPLLRHDLDQLVRLIAATPAVRDLALTTNGVLLDRQADTLAAAGLRRVTVSLDTLRRDRFRALTRRDDLERTLAGIAAAQAAGLPVKLNTVVMRDVNDDELGELVEFGRARAIEVRFIEYMDVGGATRWERERVLPQGEILARVAARYGAVAPVEGRGADPAARFRLADGTTFGVIASTTQPFCGTCDRARLTADGHFFTCLYARDGLDLRAPLRAGCGDDDLQQLLAARWRRRDDRGAEQRLALVERKPLASASDLRRTPHLEMHTRGG